MRERNGKREMVTRTENLYGTTTLRCFDASFFIWNKLWSFCSSHRSYNKFEICDVIIYHENQIKYWLFTTRSGEVKNRSQSNRSLEMFEKSFLYDTFERVTNGSKYALVGNSSRFEEITTCGLQTSDAGSRSGDNYHIICKIMTVEDLKAVYTRKEVIKVFISPKSPSDKILRVEFQQDKMGRELTKCFLLAQSDVSGYAVPLSQSKGEGNSSVSFGFLAVTAIPCKNKAIVALCKDFCEDLIKVIQQKNSGDCSPSVYKVERLVFSVVCSDSEEASSGSHRLSLYLVDEIVYLPLNQISAGLSSGVSKAGSSMVSGSLRHAIRRFTCPGDFCSFISERLDSLHPTTGCSYGYGNDEVMSLIFEEVDIKGESHRAIIRHKRDANRSSEENEDQLYETNIRSPQPEETGNRHNTDNEEDLESKTSPGGEGDRSQVSEEAPSPLQAIRRGETKRLKVLRKDLSLAREEMEKLKTIETKILSLFPPINYDEIAAIRRAIEDIWPIRTAEFFLNSLWVGGSEGMRPDPKKANINFGLFGSDHASSAGNSISSSQSRLGPLPAVLQRKLLPLQSLAETTPTKSSNGVEEKLFSFYFSSVEVCETCYRMYHELEKYRQQRNSRFLRDLRVSKDLTGSEEERKMRDRLIEKKIFEQRKLMSRLSKPPLAPVIARSGSVASVNREGSHQSQVKVKRVQKRSQSYSHFESAPLLAYQRIMNKQPLTSHSSSSLVDEGESSNSSNYNSSRNSNSSSVTAAEKAFQEMREGLQQKLDSQYTFKPTLYTSGGGGSSLLDHQKLTVNSKNYSAEHLLHSWHRDMNRLRSLIHQNPNQNHPRLNPNDPPSSTRNKERIVEEVDHHNHNDVDDEEDDDDEEGAGDLGWNPFAVK